MTPSQITDMQVMRMRLVTLGDKNAELERELKAIKNPQFWLSAGGEWSGGSYCCHHCNFSSPKFADRDAHITSCAERKAFLNKVD